MDLLKILLIIDFRFVPLVGSLVVGRVRQGKLKVTAGYSDHTPNPAATAWCLSAIWFTKYEVNDSHLGFLVSIHRSYFGSGEKAELSEAAASARSKAAAARCSRAKAAAVSDDILLLLWVPLPLLLFAGLSFFFLESMATAEEGLDEEEEVEGGEDEEWPGTRKRAGGGGTGGRFPWSSEEAEENSSWLFSWDDDNAAAVGTFVRVAPNLCLALSEEKAREVCRARTYVLHAHKKKGKKKETQDNKVSQE